MYHTINAAALVLFKRDGHVLMGRRTNTGYANGMLCLPGGSVDKGESFSVAAVREVLEEIGVIVAPEDLEPVHVMCCRNDSGAVWINPYFVAKSWTHDFVNKELHKCSELVWVPLDALPGDIVPEIAQALKLAQEGVFYSEFLVDHQ